MHVPTCRHIKLGAGRCGSPALRGQDYCYFHAGAHRAIPSVNLPGLPPESETRIWGTARHDLPPETAAIQRGLSRLIQGLWQGSLNARQAKIILVALQDAAAGFRQRTATGDSAVTSNQVRLPIPDGRRIPSESRGG